MPTCQAIGLVRCNLDGFQDLRKDFSNCFTATNGGYFPATTAASSFDALSRQRERLEATNIGPMSSKFALDAVLLFRR